ncbi:EAL domain-containing protein [Marinobacterium jannaschii]|uniref:EAL domain-containing protein n=1 Tax=Marinobacterium jannaschii TaxID=64970 RepID=UPI0004866F3C|nr:EAL domain-containing protein [Marinobacterium jannaschii]
MVDLSNNLLAAPEQDPLKVLVVDDREENHRVIKRILKNINAEIYSALSGKEALSLTLRHQFAVVLLDVMMPEMDGFETAEMIKLNEDTKNLPIIFITAADRTEAFELRGYESGAVDYLFKPIKPHALESKVRIFLELEEQRYRLEQSTEDLKRTENRIKLLLDSIGEGIIGLDIAGKVIFCNPASLEILGLEESDLLGNCFTSFSQLPAETNPEEVECWENTQAFLECSQGNHYKCVSAVFYSSDGVPISIEYNATPVQNEGDFFGVVVAFQDVTERKKAEEQLRRLAQYDSLTGLYNRHVFNRILHQALSRANRSKLPLALLFIDLNKFKQVNDNLGHEVGDCLLQEVAQRLSACVRDGDIISRLGGDEFTIILENFINKVTKNAASVADKILNQLSEPFNIKDNVIYIGASIGIAIYPDSGSSAPILLQAADMAMYKAKARGGNCYQFFTDEMQREALEAVALDRELLKAVECGHFELQFQPQVSIMTGRIVGVEALLRWKNSKGDYVSPEIFIPRLEEMGAIEKVGYWVIEEAFSHAARWSDYGMQHNFTIAVNLSIRQLSDNALVSVISRQLKRQSLQGCKIEVEVTESMMMSDPAKTVATLSELADMGLLVAVDDFGTGYSSLSYLNNLPLSVLKIDKSFVQEIGCGSNTEEIIKTIIALGKALKLNVIAEGVEESFQVDFLREHECDVIQGFFYSKPMISTEVEKLFDKRFCQVSDNQWQWCEHIVEA